MNLENPHDDNPTLDKPPKRRGSKRGGRPKGRPNHDYEAVRSIPRRCPSCAATTIRTFKVIARQPHRGTAPDGLPYTEVIRKRGRCESCGQMLIVTEYECGRD